MTLERRIAAVFSLDVETWRRHAHPWSVITRNTVLPVLVIAFWSRIWLSWWCLIPIFLGLAWTWLNPRLFNAPESFDHWTSRSVLGEQIWLNRDQVPVPVHHRNPPRILSAISGIGMLLVIIGVFYLHIWLTLTGSLIVYLSKLWFLDRMVWLFADMHHEPDRTGEEITIRDNPGSPVSRQDEHAEDREEC